MKTLVVQFETSHVPCVCGGSGWGCGETEDLVRRGLLNKESKVVKMGDRFMCLQLDLDAPLTQSSSDGSLCCVHQDGASMMDSYSSLGWGCCEGCV